MLNSHQTSKLAVPNRKNIRKQSPTKSDRERELDAIAEEGCLLDEDAANSRLDDKLRFGVVQDEPEQELGQRLHDSRQLAGLTQDQLARRTKRADKQQRGISAAVTRSDSCSDGRKPKAPSEEYLALGRLFSVRSGGPSLRA